MGSKTDFFKVNIQGIIAIIIIIIGFYLLSIKTTPSDVKMAIVGLMSMVVGYYFGSSEHNKKIINDNENK